MEKSMGQTLKMLRKQKGLTQEELANIIHVSPQAVSKWESASCMPDITQIVPLARLFKVSTDFLLGMYDEDDNENVKNIILETAEDKDEYEAYLILVEFAKKYPGNIIILIAVLERGMGLAYPENDCFNRAHAMEIYEEVIRVADLIIAYSKNATDVLRAHMVAVMLHSVYGNQEKAREHIAYFPMRADMTQSNMEAYIEHSAKNYKAELGWRHWEYIYLCEALVNSMANVGIAYMSIREYENALAVFDKALNIIVIA